MDKKLANTIKYFLAAMLILCLAVCLFWYPTAVEYVLGYMIFPGARGLLYILGGAVTLPLLGIIGVAFRFPSLIVADAVFTRRTARLIKSIAITLFADCSLFAVVVVWVFAAGESVLSPALGFVAAIGFTVALMLYALSDYVGRAAALKEEADYTL